MDHVLPVFSHAVFPRFLRLLPVDLRRFVPLARAAWPARVLPVHTLDSERLLAALIRQHLFIRLYHACAESMAAEQQMCLRAMQATERNIEERLEAPMKRNLESKGVGRDESPRYAYCFSVTAECAPSILGNNS